MNSFNKILGAGAFVGAALFVSASTSQAASLVVNPGFETSPAGFTANPITLGTVGQGWATFGTSGQNDMSSSPDSPQSGLYSLLEVNAAGNAWSPAGAYQIVAGSGSTTYSASIYALTDTGVVPGADGWTTPVDLQIAFWDSTLTSLGSVETGWSAISALHTWQQYTISGTSPAGTAYVGVYAMNMVGAGTVASVNVYFDNATLQVVPEPSTLALAGLGVASLFLGRRRKN